MATNNGLNTSLSGQTGTGSFAGSTSPSFTTPTIGIATATSVNKVTITAPATSSTLTIADGKTLTCSNTLTLSGTDSSSVAFGAGGTVSYAVVDAWVAYTPTFTGFGTPTNISIFSRRVGSNLEIMGRFTTGTCTATEARMTIGYNGVSANVTSSNTVISTLVSSGILIGTVAFAGSLYTLAPQNKTYINFGVQNAGNSGFAASNATAVFNNASDYTIMASLPISGW